MGGGGWRHRAGYTKPEKSTWDKLTQKRTGSMIYICIRVGALKNRAWEKSYELIIYEEVQI